MVYARAFEADPLSSCVPRSQGGVKLVSGSGRITLDNTMEERLRLLEDKVRLPAKSFGPQQADPIRTDVTRNQTGPLRKEREPQILHMIFAPVSLDSSSFTASSSLTTRRELFYSQ